MPSFHATLSSLVEELVRQLLEAVRGSSLQELLGPAAAPRAAKTFAAPSQGRGKPAAPAPARAKRRAQGRHRSQEAIEAMSDRIVALVAASPNGLHARELRARLHLSVSALALPLRMAHASKRLVLHGTRGSGALHKLAKEPSATNKVVAPTRGKRAVRPSPKAPPTARVTPIPPTPSEELEGEHITDPDAVLNEALRPRPTLPPTSNSHPEKSERLDAPKALATPMLRHGEEFFRTASGQGVLRRRRDA